MKIQPKCHISWSQSVSFGLMSKHVINNHCRSEKRRTDNSMTSTSSSSSARVSTQQIRLIIEKLKCTQTHETMAKHYIGIWRKFNRFLIKLDTIPNSWKDRAILYAVVLVHDGTQSNMLKSYMSAIKSFENWFKWDMEWWTVWVCILKNDAVHPWLPIKKSLLETLLFDIKRTYDQQPYLKKLYMALFSLAYYELMRVGELTKGDDGHTMLAKNVYSATNKNKILIVLYSSKTHNNSPQEIKISEVPNVNQSQRHFCPFQLVRDFFKVRPDIADDNELFFIFRWFKFTLKPPNRITGEKLRLTIWDTSFWTFWVKFGHNGPWDIS